MYCDHGCAREARQAGARIYKAEQRGKYRELLGEDRYKKLTALDRWIDRHPNVSERFLLRPILRTLIADYLEDSPDDAATYEDAMREQIRNGWRLFAEGREAEAHVLAEMCSGALDVRPGIENDRMILLCRELLIDTASETEVPHEITARELGIGCAGLVSAWADQKDPKHSVTAIMRYANFLRAYPEIESDSYRRALELFRIARRLCELVVPGDEGWLIIEREIAHRTFQILSASSRHTKAAEQLNVIDDLTDEIGSIPFIVHKFEIHATHNIAIGNSDRTEECLAQAWMRADGATLSPWNKFSVLRADIDHCLKANLGDRAAQRISEFATLLESHPFPYQQRQLAQRQPRGATFRKPYRMVAALPLFAALFISES